MNRRVTLVDIAKATGYSVNSVSRALMDAPDISDKTKRKIKDVADELGYIPNMAAASLKKGNSKIIGVLYDDLLNPYYNTICCYLERVLSQKGYMMIYYRKTDFDLNLYNSMISRNLEGIISFLVPTDEVERRINIQKFPTVIIGRKAKYISSVYADDIKIGVLAAKSLIEAGCSKPIYIGEGYDIEICRLRADGFVKELASKNIKPQLYFCGSGAKFDEVVENCLQNVNFDSIFCFSDLLAFKALKYLMKYKRNDVVVVGVDNVQNEIPIPANLMSIGQNKEEIVNDVVELLFNQISGIDMETKFIKKEIFIVKEN